MKKRSRFFVLFSALILVLSGCSSVSLSDQQFDLSAQRQEEAAQPSDQPVQDAAEPVSELCLACSMTDSFNPYRMKTQLNQELIPLMYDSLTRPDKTYRPENQLAQEVTVDGKTCTVKFRRDALFTDGTPLTGRDIIYSITTAASSDTNWKFALRNVATCAVNEDGDVEIHLYSSDADFAALLSFPIIKEGTAGEDFPTGVSRYYLTGTEGNTAILTANQYYYGEQGNIETIRLKHINDVDALAFDLKTGEIDLLFSDLSSPDFGNISASSLEVSLNHLVYVGINGNRGLLTNPQFRQALSLAINRDELVSTAYVSRARQTMYPFHPDFYRLEGMELSTPRLLNEAELLLEGLGLTQKDGEGYRLRNNAPVTLRLLVNSENAYRNAVATLLAEQLGQLGIKVEIVSRSFSQYQSSLDYSDYDLYLGEIRLTDNMDFSMLLAGGSLGYATPYSEAVADAYTAYRQYGSGISTLCDSFSEETPFIPLVFREGILSFNRTFGAEIVATEQDIFYNIEEW